MATSVDGFASATGVGEGGTGVAVGSAGFAVGLACSGVGVAPTLGLGVDVACTWGFGVGAASSTGVAFDPQAARDTITPNVTNRSHSLFILIVKNLLFKFVKLIELIES